MSKDDKVKHKIVKVGKLKINDKIFDGKKYWTVKSTYKVGVLVTIQYKESRLPSEWYTSKSVTIKA